MGFRTFVPESVFKREKYLAGPDEDRAGQLTDLFEDKTVRGIICARGGFGSIRILSLIDFDRIRNNPKIFVGFSDITSLLTVLYSACGLITFHGPMVTTLDRLDRKSRDTLFSALTSGKKMKITPEKGATIKSGSASGRVVCGNLTTFCHLIGTPFQPNLEGHILVLEDIGEVLYKIDRMLIQMKLAGCFNDISGIALGTFEDCDKIDDIYDIVHRTLRDYDFPVLGGFGIGHGKTNMTVPFGAKATLDADNHMILFHEPATAQHMISDQDKRPS